MSLLVVLAGMSVGCICGIGIGYAYGWTRGHVVGSRYGQDRVRRSAELWQELASGTSYAVAMVPHGGQGHVCTSRCYPSR